MKTRTVYWMISFFLVTVCLLSGCATPKRTVPQKPPVPEKEAPELGARPPSELPSSHSLGVVSELKHKAERQIKAGDLDQAFSTLEQALRINPSDPAIWSLLAEIQLARGNAEQSEQLARKSNLLAKNDRSLSRRNWLIIAQALEQRGLAKEAAAAKRRAENGRY